MSSADPREPAGATPGPTLDRTSPPTAGPVVPYRFPEFTRRRLPSGLEVIPAPVAGTPLVELELVLPAGATRDPADRPGLAALVAGLLDEGTSERSALEIASAIERIGGRLDAGTNWNVATAGVRVLAANLDEGLDLLAEIVRRPTFPEEEVERARRNRLTDLLRRRDSPGVLATDNLYRLIYGDTIYGRPLLGTPTSVRCIRRDDLVGFYRHHYQLGEATLLAAGDLDPDRLEQSVAERFETAGGPPSPAAPETAPSPSVPERTRVRLRIVDRPGSAQTELRLGHAAVPRTHPDWDALGVLNTLFGGKFTSRINLILREKHGITYGASSRFVPRLGTGPFVTSAAVSNEGAGLAVREVLDELERLRQEPVGSVELADTKSYLLGVFPYTLQTVDGLLYHLNNLAVYDLPDDHYAPETFMARLDAVDRESLLGAARRHLHPDRASVVAVGPAAELAPQLEGLGELEVVSLRDGAPPGRGG